MFPEWWKTFTQQSVSVWTCRGLSDIYLQLLLWRQTFTFTTTGDLEWPDNLRMLLEVGGNWRTWHEPMQTRVEHGNCTQKNPRPGTEQWQWTTVTLFSMKERKKKMCECDSTYLQHTHAEIQHVRSHTQNNILISLMLLFPADVLCVLTAWWMFSCVLNKTALGIKAGLNGVEYIQILWDIPKKLSDTYSVL